MCMSRKLGNPVINYNMASITVDVYITGHIPKRGPQELLIVKLVGCASLSDIFCLNQN